ncbi:hypothetical protein VP01_2172g3 [Puccinia sorghi]|uniref:DDE Tnp4 domain-containing protein n=1 Tax=Puccinia sorghi TaxID=27349 RepID=A0A0L6VA23_9BASI|nr:hypothetical protein VP01_2172g3 [Puccinia sorghi]
MAQSIQSLLISQFWLSHKQRPLEFFVFFYFEILTFIWVASLMKAPMSKENFIQLANCIRGDPIFLPKGNKPQAPVEWQLLVMLSNLGLLGMAGGSAFLSNVFGISVGSVFNYTYHCLQALILRKKEFVSWPTSEQRAARRGILSQTNLFKNCVGFNKEDYWMRKMLYGLNSIIFCDHGMRIIYALHGWFGSAHDSRVMRASHISNSGYPCHPVIVPAFKKSRGGYLDRPHKKFNYLLSLQQVVVEHKIGVLKRRWKTLTNLPLVISNENSAARASIWIRVCCMLHNYLLDNQSEDLSFLGRQAQVSEEACGTDRELWCDGIKVWRNCLFKEYQQNSISFKPFLLLSPSM